ncbi:MAG: CorA family divalent cation transporter, partial [Calditrichota bacterium]
MLKHHTIARKHKKPGTSPGSLIYSGERKTESVRISVIDYDANDFKEFEVNDIQECGRYRETDQVTWINIDGLHEESVLATLGAQYQIHPLVLEDILNPNQRPKLEDYKNYLYLVLRMITYDTTVDRIDDEQFSLILGPHFVLSFQEKPGDVFDNIRKRLRNPQGRLRTTGPEYLAY